MHNARTMMLSNSYSAQTCTKPVASSALAEFAKRGQFARPVFRKQAGCHVAVKRRERPIAHAPDKAVLQGIDVAIFNVTAIVLAIPDQVLPEAPLPNTPLTASAGCGAIK